MLLRYITTIAIASLASLLLAMSADATSRFTAENQTDEKINVYIFTGGDTFCSVQEKLKSFSAGETDSYGCTGNGKNRCQIQLYADGRMICKKQHNSCYKDNARKMKNGSKVVITRTEDDGYYCSFY